MATPPNKELEEHLHIMQRLRNSISEIEGVRALYPKIPINIKIRAWIAIFRSFTLIPVIFGGFFGTLLALGYHNEINRIFIDWQIWIHAIATLILLQCANNSLNQSTDLAEDRVNKPYRPIPQRLITIDEARTFSWIIFLIVLFRALTINFWFGFFTLIIMLTGICYSLEPIRFKKRIYSNFSIGFARGFCGILVAWCIFYPPAITPIIIGILFFLFVSFQIIQKDWTDIEGDKIAGNSNIVIKYGTKAQFISVIGMLVPFFLIPPLIFVGLLKYKALWIFALFLIPTILIMYYHRKPYDTHDKLVENTPLWKWSTLLLALLQLTFGVSYAI